MKQPTEERSGIKVEPNSPNPKNAQVKVHISLNQIFTNSEAAIALPTPMNNLS